MTWWDQYQHRLGLTLLTGGFLVALIIEWLR
jgi:hypothetical protein